MPYRLLALDQKAPHQISRRKIFVASYGDERTFEPPGHVFDKARLATTRRAFQNHGQMRGVRSFEQIDLVVDGQVIRLVDDLVLFDGAFRHDSVRLTSIESAS